MTASRLFFTEKLLEWNREANSRNMPWKGEKNPYRIWLSEIILQQTRVEQGWPYYERFIQHYPTVTDLAQAPEEEVFRLWQGLGYYARCKNMLAAAREITDQYQGKFPDQYDQIKALKGIGPYTAAAVASFAFNLPHAVLDGNVYRVLARYFGIDTPIDSTAGKKQFGELAQALLPAAAAAEYNQSIMDFGAVVCKPQQPTCNDCPLNRKCIARQQQLVAVLPVKTKKLQIKKRYFNYLLVTLEDNIYIRKRTENDIWQNLHEFILIETDEPTDITHLQAAPAFQNIFKSSPGTVENISAPFKQQLTHQTIHTRFITVAVKKPLAQQDWMLVPGTELNNYAFPKTITSFLQQHSMQLF
ncbi:A/G-specific adenine glycosylase [Chitinophaga nivalis]|uniref:Adenine DNA glycosylase n=1 Tax=Chitinophaga nivalis TaxID=2991709 RepID=A0ABT3IWL2_9BACT|nr:A/G-specific adenine glycosylase [Chitinophaga nivalis]MCW3462214.1 A/G-specific adenine glycosylase [Chitinophaga nivalis]MCW3488094.1 A/G-specific adenine glycosylase [Chitinophaga nivalis]